MFDKIPAQALSDTVAQQIQLQIEKGSFVKTGKLPTEAVLAQAFGVSRTVIREAISRLKNEGVVEARQGSGVFIAGHGAIRPLRIDYAEAVEAGSVLQILALRRASGWPMRQPSLRLGAESREDSLCPAFRQPRRFCVLPGASAGRGL